MDESFERAKEFFLAGVRHYEAGRYEQAHAQFEASLSFVPQRASTLMNLGATRIQLGRFEEAAEVLEEATEVDPSDAQAWAHLATALAELGRHEDALRCADKALALDAALASTWSVRGMLLRDLQRPQEAVESFRKAIERGADAPLHEYYIAAITGEAAPSQTPARYVQTLFDSYADGFEDHLVEVLRYGAPGILAGGLPQREWRSALDLGCGTGLMGEQLKPRVARLVGVDLSANMVGRARERGLYDDVVQADVTGYLASAKEASFELVTAADVFNYIGELAPVFDAVRRVLAPDGWFAFTVELTVAGADVELQPSMRYAHSRGYVESLATRCDFEVAALAEHPIREDQRQPIPGLFAWLRNPRT
ncbi:tetratricopeptide repeat protein [Ramlibacter sp. PS4R-6]|uniref:tetratricopeptide repeat protein n=1 Tax=Ramlibacter sp. PS4R-6 TaxID=3133438 RepID=UPI00309E33A8